MVPGEFGFTYVRKEDEEEKVYGDNYSFDRSL